MSDTIDPQKLKATYAVLRGKLEFCIHNVETTHTGAVIMDAVCTGFFPMGEHKDPYKIPNLYKSAIEDAGVRCLLAQPVENKQVDPHCGLHIRFPAEEMEKVSKFFKSTVMTEKARKNYEEWVEDCRQKTILGRLEKLYLDLTGRENSPRV